MFASRGPCRLGLPALLLALAAAGAAVVARGPATGEGEEPDLDEAFYEARIAPIVHGVCGECHADPRRRLGKHHLLPAPGRRIRERHHRRNLETLRRYIEPGDPSASLWLLKAIGPDQGGVTHGGGRRIELNSPEYGAMVDWIQGARLERPPFEPPPRVEGQPDFRFYVAKVAPIFAQVCAECHAGRGQARFKLLTDDEEEAEDLSLEEHRANFNTALRLLEPGKPTASRLLLKPLARADGGIAHRGGDHIAAGDARHAIFLAFIAGQAGPPLPSERGRAPRRLDFAGLAIEAEDVTEAEGATELEDAQASGFHVVEAQEGGGRLAFVLDVADAGTYRVTARAAGGKVPILLELGEGMRSALVPLEAPAVAGEVGPQHIVDRGRPLAATGGALDVRDGLLWLDGRTEEAGFLLPVVPRREGCSAEFRLPHEEDGGTEFLLLFDALDRANARYLGLVDGGRRVVLGSIEGGVRRPLAGAEARFAEPFDVRTLKVEHHGGVAVGFLDGQAVVFHDLGVKEPVGTYGAATRGRAAVEGLAALDGHEIDRTSFALGPFIHLERGPHRFVVLLPEGSGRLDSLSFSAP